MGKDFDGSVLLKLMPGEIISNSAIKISERTQSRSNLGKIISDKL
jgi:hypothetical protein